VQPHTIKLDQGKIVTVDGVTVSLPHSLTDIGANIIYASSMFLQVRKPSKFTQEI